MRSWSTGVKIAATVINKAGRYRKIFSNGYSTIKHPKMFWTLPNETETYVYTRGEDCSKPTSAIIHT